MARNIFDWLHDRVRSIATQAGVAVPRGASDAAVEDTQAYLRRTLPPSFARLLKMQNGWPDAWNGLYLSGVFGPFGFLVMIAGIGMMILYLEAPGNRAWLYACTGVLVIIGTALFNDHFLMWASRRFIPVIVPLGVIAIVFAVREAAMRTEVRALKPAAALAVLALVLWTQLPASAVMIRTRDWLGLQAWYRQVDNAIPDEALIYSDQPGFAAPLRYMYNRRSYELQARDDDRYRRLYDLMAEKKLAGHDVLLLTMKEHDLPEPWSLEPLLHAPLSSAILQHHRTGIPKGTKERGGDFTLYRLVERESGGSEP